MGDLDNNQLQLIILCDVTNHNNNKVLKDCFERLIPIKCPNWQAEDKASGNPSPAPGLHVVEPFGLTGEGAKCEFLAPLNNQCSG